MELHRPRAARPAGAPRRTLGAGARPLFPPARGAAPPRAVARGNGVPDPAIELVNGAVTSGPDLSVEVNGLKLPNPFVIGSGPPGTNLQVMRKAFEEGWGGVICKTLSLDAAKVVNVTPRYAKLRDGSGAVFGWENIELISDRPFETMLAEMRQLKQEFPDRVLIASIMEEISRQVCGWANAVATKPVWAKMTPNITDISVPALAALNAGCEGVAAINTIQSVMGINLDTLRPEPAVEGHTTPGGYSYKAVKPIALAKVMAISKAMAASGHTARGASLSGIGGVDSGADAAEFILLGADTVQVCTGVMIHGYPVVKNYCAGLQSFMRKHGFNSISEFRGASLPYFTTHSDLVARQRAALAAKKARVGLANDAEWSGEDFVANAESMVANR
ncbi:hypothetical protein Rsub_09857 [Raphidocelis subcapitata]|uniref:dihydropyrimidine dehydrogenase (NADP(+)) n=1 Tax=Raphidocelis subcapitata TaxID=307507 RepID=A0A2V0PHJ1_9CHLO|nr:hypothetical protein Rsub_09857 [Raphidocelis subcapitata]|eukprot:GBF96515.1 hypothetical protein Rsub_09857 [Raphidocelis subcapitata]